MVEECIFITRDFNRGWGKENGTIPFYRRFFDRINKIIKTQNEQARIHRALPAFADADHFVDFNEMVRHPLAAVQTSGTCQILNSGDAFQALAAA